jgi:hypothetical protein
VVTIRTLPACRGDDGRFDLYVAMNGRALHCISPEVFRVSDDGPSRGCGEAPGPWSESLQRKNPREVGGGSAARAMGISARCRLTWPLLRWLAE